MKRPDGWLVFTLLVVAGAIAMCARDQLGHRTAATPASSARALGIYPPARPAGLAEEGLAALERDAHRREARFLDAVDPGHLWRSTRLGDGEAAARAAAELYEIGGQLFHHRFLRREGFGTGERSALRRVQQGDHGPDAYSCQSCHRRGGPAGAGDAADNAYLDGDGDSVPGSLARNPIPLHGAGLVELLAREMTEDLAALRDGALRGAKREGKAQTVALESKGVSFGTLTADPAGALDLSGIEGVDRDLVVKPFGWKGHAHSLRDVVRDELWSHHGMQLGDDADGDGVAQEISGGQLDALTLFVAMQELPQVVMPSEAHLVAGWLEGQRRFEAIGCARCHVPSLPLRSTVYTLPGGVRVDLATDGAEPRIARPAEGGPHRVYLFSDLKRHVVGPNLREPRPYRGVGGADMITPPLWGIARSRPYLHDARAPTLEDAILEHSGEATEARNRYAALDDAGRAPIRIYLTSLTRAPRMVAP